LRSYVVFDEGKTDQIVDKIIQLNGKYKENDALTPSEISSLKSLNTVLKNKNQYHVTKVDENSVKFLSKIVDHWAPEDVFPALDFLRLLIMHPEAAEIFSKEKFNNILYLLEKKGLPWQTQLMIMRFICNSFRWTSLRESVSSQFARIMPAIDAHKTHEKQQVRVAYSTILLNFSHLFSEETGKTLQRRQMLPAVFESLRTEIEEEGQFRAFLTLGTLLTHREDTVQLRTDIMKNVAYMQSLGGMKPASQKVADALKELQMIFTGKFPVSQSEKVNVDTSSTTSSTTPSMPNIPGFGGIPPEMMNRISSNPQMMQALQNPAVMAKLQRIMQDPMLINQMRDDPDIAHIISMFNNM